MKFSNLRKYAGLGIVASSTLLSGCEYYSYTMDESALTLTPYEISRFKVMEVQNRDLIITPEGMFFQDRDGKRYLMSPKETRAQVIARIKKDKIRLSPETLADIPRNITPRN